MKHEEGGEDDDADGAERHGGRPEEEEENVDHRTCPSRGAPGAAAPVRAMHPVDPPQASQKQLSDV